VSVLLCVVDDHDVLGVTQLHDVVYIVCFRSSTIIRFDAVTRQRLTDISVRDLSDPYDIAACEHTSSVYVSDYSECVCRVSSDCADVKRWLQRSLASDIFRPHTLSVTSSRLLVTSWYTKQLRQFDAVGDELSQVDLPRDMYPLHAVESLTGTFIVSHNNTQLKHQVSEVNTGGQVLRQFSGSRLIPLGVTPHIAVDSQGNIFVVDHDTGRIQLLDSQLALRRVIVDEHQLNYKQPWRLCYIEHSGQLLVGFYEDRDVAVFDVLHR